MPELWRPGPQIPQREFVERLHRSVEDFVSRRGHARAFVEVELEDGSRFALHSISPEPGSGFVTLTPFPEDEERPWPQPDGGEPCPPDALIVPLSTIRRITLGEAAEHRIRFGFSLPEAAASD